MAVWCYARPAKGLSKSPSGRHDDAHTYTVSNSHTQSDFDHSRRWQQRGGSRRCTVRKVRSFWYLRWIYLICVQRKTIEKIGDKHQKTSCDLTVCCQTTCNRQSTHCRKGIIIYRNTLSILTDSCAYRLMRIRSLNQRNQKLSLKQLLSRRSLP